MDMQNKDKEAIAGMASILYREITQEWPFRLEQYTKEDKGDKTMKGPNCGTQVEAKEGQVNQELNNAENATGRVVTRIDELEKQLFNVLRASEAAPPTLSKEAQVEASLVPLANRIKCHYKILQDLGTHIGEILGRLEIR